MPVNQATIASLLARPVPPELQCVLPQETADAIAEIMQVVGLASQITSGSGVAVPITNNTGQQALTLAQSLQVIVAELQTKTLQRRVVVDGQGIPAGNSNTPFTFTPAMPDTNYIILVEFIAGAGHVTIPTWRTRAGTKTSTGFTLLLDNVPADCIISIVIEERRSII
jgi:hypothetical protein